MDSAKRVADVLAALVAVAVVSAAAQRDTIHKIGLFDTTPHDCTISEPEIENNSLIMSLFAPDVMVDGQQAVSIGVQVTAVHAEF